MRGNAVGSVNVSGLVAVAGAWCIVLAGAVEGLGATYYVSKSGDDNNTGQTMGTAYRTISRAATQPACDTCYIGAGVYRETVTPGHDNMTFEAYVPPEPNSVPDLVVVSGANVIEDNKWSHDTADPPGLYKATFGGGLVC